MNSTLTDTLSYLNQSNYILVDKKLPFSLVINLPYQFARSLISSVRLQVMDSLDPTSISFNQERFYESVGYFFSNYALLCFFSAIILNRMSSMSGLRSSLRSANLPRWSSILVHSISLFLLGYGTFKALVQYEVIDYLKPLQTDEFLSLIYTVFVTSHCLETFIAATTNLHALEESDYSIFELSIEFYSITKSNTCSRYYVPDCLMALIGRIIIHSLEIFKKREKRLLFATITNIAFLSFLLWQIFNEGIESIPIITRFRHFPKLFALFCIGLSLLCYFFAYIVRWNPGRTPNVSRVQDLQYYSFMNDWWSHLRVTGVEEFTTTVMKLATLLFNPDQNSHIGLQNELSELRYPTELHKSFLVSRYLNKINSIPDDRLNKDDSDNSDTHPIWSMRLRWVLKMMYFLFDWIYLFVNIIFKRSKNSIHFEKQGNSDDLLISECITDINDLDSKNIMVIEKDTSKDYIPGDDEDNEEDNEYEYLSDDSSNDQILYELALPDFTSMMESPNEMSWYVSMYSILRCKLERNSRMTRSDFGKLYENEILIQMNNERACKNIYTIKNNSGVVINKNEDIDVSCVVCKVNQRSIVLWPCKCFALCEECRVSLGLRGFKTCICCRSEVRGYSKLNNV